jgi:hypothetical protein
MADKKKVYEIIHGMLGIDAGKPPRTVGAEVTEEELRKAKVDIDRLVKDGILRDTALPLAPAAVSEHVTDHFLELAQVIGVVTNDGAKYSIDGQTFNGLAALRAAVTTASLKAAIAKFVEQKNAAIAEITSRLPKE